MKINEVFWPDSKLLKVEIEYNRAQIFINHNDTQKDLIIVCDKFIGMTNLCIWDDLFVSTLKCENVLIAQDDAFLNAVLNAYDLYENYDERRLSDGILRLTIELSNGIKWQLYCQNMEVFEKVYTTEN